MNPNSPFNLSDMLRGLAGMPDPEPQTKPYPKGYKPKATNKHRVKLSKDELKRRSSQSKRDRKRKGGKHGRR